jgi:lon-related putative ATP-dependent protease
MDKYRIKQNQLTAECNLSSLSFADTGEITPLEGIIGQERAKKALEFGLKIKSDGYNIFVTGISGTGRTTSVEQAVRKTAAEQKVPDDWCYIYNFANPDTPQTLCFPAGKAIIFHKDMDNLLKELVVDLPKAFESQIYTEHKNQIIKKLQSKRTDLFDQLEKSAKDAGFQIKKSPAGIAFIPAPEGKPLNEEDMEHLTDKAKEEIREKQEILYGHLTEILRKVRKDEKAAKEELENLDKQTARYTVQPKIEELKEKYKDLPDVLDYLKNVEKDTVENVDDFKEQKEQEVLPGLKMPEKQPPFYKYKVNVLIDNSQVKGAPVIKETNPTPYNLSGRIEYKPQFGAMITDFTMIKPGALHRANGGYLIIQSLDVLKNYFSWETLKRAIKDKEIAIEDLNEQFRLINTPTLRPQPISLKVKIILIGEPMIYYLLYSYDEDFKKLFKVKGDFSTVMDRDKKGIQDYSSFVSKICTDEKLKHFKKEAVGKLIEYGSRVAEDQKKLTTRFIEIADLIREANFWAETDNSKLVEAKHIKKALEEKVYRSNLLEKRIGDLIQEGTIMVDTDGEKIGQINGLSYLKSGDYAFGKPTKITAKVYIGKNGMVNIDREVKLAGTIHNKGFMILNGYLGQKYANNAPLVFSASVCFEQLYEEIEGDSASSTELYVLLSSLADMPIKQNIAVTGSVNQNGEVQPVGGINEKIEGFYYTCKSKRLTGKQGVIIPEKNIKHLLLNDEIRKEIKKGNFHVWSVKTIDEGIEILTGKPAGKIKKDGTYPKGTVNYKVAKKLKELTEKFTQYQSLDTIKKTRRKKKN